MDEKNINLQALEKGDQNKVERNGDEKISSEGGLEHDGPNPVQVSLKDAEQSHFTETNFDRKSHMNSKTPDIVPVVEATQELEPEEKGGFASTPRVTPVPFDLNVVDGEGMEEQIPLSSDLQESPREVNQSRSGSLKFDLNRSSSSPPASPSPSYSSSSSSSSSSVPQPFIENFDRNDTEEPHIHNDYLLHGAEPDASVFRIMGTNVEIKKNKGVPETLPPPNNGKALYLFGYDIRGMAVRATSSPLSAVQPPPLSLSCLTSTGGTNSKEPGGGLEPSMASSSSSTVVGEGKEPEGDIRGMAVRAICSPSAVVQPPPLPLSCVTSTGGTETKEPEGDIRGMAVRAICSPSAVVQPPPLPLSCVTSTGGTETKEPESDVRGMAVMATCSPSAVVEPPPLSLSRLTSTGGRGTKRKEPEGSQEPYVAKKNRACSC